MGSRRVEPDPMTSLCFDSTRGYPGEGPYLSTLRNVRGSSTLLSAFQAKAREFPQTLTDAQIQCRLELQALNGNHTQVVGSRFQERPDMIRELLPDSEFVNSVATQGVAYEFKELPHQVRRPRQFSKSPEEKKAELSEVQRLHSVDAIEPAPIHDEHKPILRSQARPFELSDPPPMRLDIEPVPVCETEDEVIQMNRQAERRMRLRVLRSEAFRDVESATFVIPKRTGGWRYCTNYKTTLNPFQPTRHFKMEGLQQLREMVRHNDYAIIMDLRDFYLQLGIHPAYRRYCRFRDPEGRRWQWKTLSFGISHAVRLATKLLRPLIQQFRALGINIFSYVDDIVVMAPTKHETAAQASLLLQMLQEKMNLKIKLSKCDFVPRQQFTALGVEWDTRLYRAQLPKRKVLALQRISRRLLNASRRGQRVSTRDLSRFVGTAEASRVAVGSAKRRMIYLQHQLSDSVREKGFSGTLKLSDQSMEALDWWASKEPFRQNGQPICPRKRFVLVTFGADASTGRGWGAWLRYGELHLQTRGYFTLAERRHMINLLELIAQDLGLRALLPRAIDEARWHEVSVRALCDNVAAVKYGNMAVGRSLTMSVQGAKMFDWRTKHRLQVRYEHRAGVRMEEADGLSRKAWTHADWALSWAVFHNACRAAQVRPTFDLFASRSNRKTKRYFSWNHEHQAVGTDAFLHRWDTLGACLYAFPPPSLLGRTLQKARQDEVRKMFIIAPAWTSASWFPTLLSMCEAPPVVLPLEQALMWSPAGAPAFHCRWTVCAWTISGQPGNLTPRCHGPPSSVRWRASTRKDILDRMTLLLQDSSCGASTPKILINSILLRFQAV